MSQPNGSFQIPLVNFSKYLYGSSEEQKACVAEIMQGFTTSGFLYLTDSGLSPNEAYEWSAKYFALPVEEKNKWCNDDPKKNRGYSGMGQEKTSNLDIDTNDPEAVARLRSIVPDLKESLEIGSDEGRYPKKAFENEYPDKALPGFGEAMRQFYEQCDALHHALLQAIAEGLGVEKEFFKDRITTGDHVLRLLHYPAVSKAILDKDPAVRAGSHTDYGTVTLLFQDGSGGLQVKNPQGEWLNIAPIEGAIVINAADLLQIWTNDVIKSTHHRVVSPPNAKTTDDGCYSARYSIAYFAHPDHERTVETISTCITEARPQKYSLTLPSEWITNRLTATY